MIVKTKGDLGRTFGKTLNSLINCVWDGRGQTRCLFQELDFEKSFEFDVNGVGLDFLKY